VEVYLQGRYILPSVDEMHRITLRDEKRYTGHFYKAARHTMQVDSIKYAYEMKKELQEGYKRAQQNAFADPFPAIAKSFESSGDTVKEVLERVSE